MMLGFIVIRTKVIDLFEPRPWGPVRGLSVATVSTAIAEFSSQEGDGYRKKLRHVPSSCNLKIFLSKVLDVDLSVKGLDLDDIVKS